MNNIPHYTSPIEISSLVIEPFTQRPFPELVRESADKNLSHVFIKLLIKDDPFPTIYDARYLCKYLFELVISKEGRMVRLKKRTDPLQDRRIEDILFFEASAATEYKKGLYIGNQKDFIQGCDFRSKIFNRNDPFDSLSINFMFKDKEIRKTGKRPFILIGISFVILCFILISCSYSVIHNEKIVDPIKKYLK